MDLGSYLGHKKDRQGTSLWMLWVHLMMELVLYPYAAIQDLLWVSEVVRVDSRDPDNPFRWDNIRLNLPGDPSYSPKIPWMSKLWGGVQELGADFTTYVDYSIVSAGPEKEPWREAQRVGSIWQYLGLQDAPRKRKMYRKGGGPWRGTKVHIIYGSISYANRDKMGKDAARNLKWMQRVASVEPLDCKELQSYQVLLNYLFATHSSCRPFLKGMHLTLDSCRSYWDSEGWK